MIIVAGTFDVAPEDRDRFLETTQESVTTSRGEKGCIEYAMSADGLDPGRVRLFEIWETEEDLDNHLVIRRSTPPSPDRPPMLGRSVIRYEISWSRSND